MSAQQFGWPPGFRLHLFMIADHTRDFRHLSEHIRVDLRGASGHQDGRAWIVLCSAPDCLARASNRFRCYRTCVDDHGVIQASFRRMAAHHLRFVGVQAASERNQLRAGRSFGICHDFDVSGHRAELPTVQGLWCGSACASAGLVSAEQPYHANRNAFSFPLYDH